MRRLGASLCLWCDGEQTLAVFDQRSVLGRDLDHFARDRRLDGREQLHHFDQAQRLAGYTPNPLTDPAALEAQFRVIRERGYSLNNEENMTGLIGIAVPVFGPSGKPVAGISVHAPVFRLTLARAQEHLRRLRQATGDLADYYREQKHASEDRV